MPSHNRIAGNKVRRQELNIQNKRASGKEKREERMRRRKAETKDPELKRARLACNTTRTLEQKRVWDDDGDEDSLYTSVDVAAVKRRKLEEDEQAAIAGAVDDGEHDGAADDSDSMLGSDVDDDDNDDADANAVNARIEKMRATRAQRQPSVAPSTTSTNFDMTPAVLSIKFPALFNDEPPKVPKVLITTSINSTLHKEAGILMSLFPNSEYIRRSAHRYGHKYSVREICKFAANRDYTTVLVLNEDQKKPNRLTVVHLPAGPTLTYSVNNWLEGAKLPGHGNAQDEFYPELLLNNFKSTLGLLAAKSFQSLFPPQPDVEARQVVTLHNQRDYIFLRRHRYIFRDKRATEKSVQAADGTNLRGVEGIRAGLQELGPRCTLKLRRVDKGIGRAGSAGADALSWEWQAGMEKARTRFNLKASQSLFVCWGRTVRTYVRTYVL